MPDDLSAFMPKLPDSVIAGAARSARLVSEVVAAESGQPESTTVVTEPPAAAPVVAPVAAPVVTPVVTTPVVTTPVHAPSVEHDEWRQRYLTLKGKYDAEVPELTGRVNGLERVLATVNTPAPATPAPAELPAPVKLEVPPADVEAYGQDLIDACRRWIAPLLQEMTTKVSRLEMRLAETQGVAQTIKQETTQDKVDRYIDSDPTLGARDATGQVVWRVLNNNPAFLAWLQKVDPFSGGIRHQLLTQAYAAGDSPRTANFFRAYLDEQTALTQPPPLPAAHTPPAPPAGAGTPTLEELAAPGRGNANPAAPGAQTEKRMWSQAEITAFYRDVQRGVYRGREPERLALEADLIAAPMEGRLTVKR